MDKLPDGWTDEWLGLEVAGATDGKGAGVVDGKAAGAGVPLILSIH
jgi:hypothetical protein